MECIKSINDVESLAKTTVTAPQDFYSLNFQLKAFMTTIRFVFGKGSILATKLPNFVKNVDGKYSIICKNRIVIEDRFAAKVLWSVGCFIQIFLEDCCKCSTKKTSSRGSSIMMASTWA